MDVDVDVDDHDLAVRLELVEVAVVGQMDAHLPPGALEGPRVLVERPHHLVVEGDPLVGVQLGDDVDRRRREASVADDAQDGCGAGVPAAVSLVQGRQIGCQRSTFAGNATTRMLWLLGEGSLR